MARSALVLMVAMFCYFGVVCEGVTQITKNEKELVGTCRHKCHTLPHRTNQFGCNRITNCRRNRKGYRSGFVRCDWCTCDCHTSPPQTKTIIKNENDLWGTCRRTCSAQGLQRSNAFGCSQIRDCHLQRKGWLRGFVRCDYCECKCV